MKDGRYVKGLFSGIFGTLIVMTFFFLVLVFLNFGGIGDVARTVFILEKESIQDLDLSQKSEGAIAGMLTELEDPYSYYLDPDEYSDLMEEVSGSYDGLGIYLTTYTDKEFTVIMAPIKGGPAFEAGILAGDEIVTINGESMAGVSADEISTLVKYGEESHFVMEVLRGDEILTFEMDRAHIDIPTVEAMFLEGESGIAYVNISNFAENTPTELSDSITKLSEEQSIQGIILDLRNNPGGSVTSVWSVADHFLTQGETVLWVEEKKQEECVEASNTNPYSYPLVVLVNENSASASEILTGALKENNRAKIVGTTTFGKGIIQSVYSLFGGGAVKVTTAEYLSPDKNKIHEVGVTPDVEVELNGEDIFVIYSLDPTYDNQLAKAIEVLKQEIGL